MLSVWPFGFETAVQHAIKAPNITNMIIVMTIPIPGFTANGLGCPQWGQELANGDTLPSHNEQIANSIFWSSVSIDGPAVQSVDRFSRKDIRRNPGGSFGRCEWFAASKATFMFLRIGHSTFCTEYCRFYDKVLVTFLTYCFGVKVFGSDVILLVAIGTYCIHVDHSLVLTNSHQKL